MKKIIGIALIALVAMAFTLPKGETKKQDAVGIKFKGISLEKAKKMALDNDQLIFIDAYTSWCGPCKKMSATTFKDEAVAELFNEQFINLKIDCEKDADGPEISRLYSIRAYPTLLVINSEGKLIKQHVGFMNADQLIAFANSIE
jgi:thiol:disulfide interchange protein